jgi:hypothetical protein
MASGGARKGAVLLHAEENIKELKSMVLRRRKHMQKSIARSLTMTRVRAEEYIISNTTGSYNPFHARKKQPNTSGRLTSRTGKLKAMLKSGISASNPLRGWSGFGNLIAKQPTSSLHSIVRVDKQNTSYEGTIRVWVKGGDSRLFDTLRGQPQESLKTLAVRFNWETGIRGNTRPIFKPVTRETDFDLRKFVEEGNAKNWRLH